MTIEFNLSEKIIAFKDIARFENSFLYGRDVKEFIRLLKKEINEEYAIHSQGHQFIINEIIDKLAGEKIK